MPRLTDTQLVLLSAAAQREDGALLPRPKRLKVAPAALTRAMKGLLNKKLVTEQPAPADAPAWRETDDQRFMLVITPAGLDAIGVESDGKQAQSSDGAERRPKGSTKRPGRKTDGRKQPGPGAVRPGTKLSLLVDMLRRNRGATIDEIVGATGWQKHSVRGAISGTVKKKLGLTVVSETDNKRGRVYRVPTAGASKGSSRPRARPEKRR
jgi:hypothetical protein